MFLVWKAYTTLRATLLPDKAEHTLREPVSAYRPADTYRATRVAQARRRDQQQIALVCAHTKERTTMKTYYIVIENKAFEGFPTAIDALEEATRQLRNEEASVVEIFKAVSKHRLGEAPIESDSAIS